MEKETHRQPEQNPGGQPRRSRLEDLRRKAERYSQAAQEAIARGLSQGNCEEQLESLKNTGGQ